MPEKISHIAIAVRSIETARTFFEGFLGLRCEHIEVVAERGVRVAFFPSGAVNLELLEPLGSDSPIAKFLEARGEGVHHLAFETDDLPAALRRAEASGIRLVNLEPVRGAAGSEVAFLHPKSTHGVLTELFAQ